MPAGPDPGPGADAAAAIVAPVFDPTATLIFIVNAASGHNDIHATRQAIEAELAAAGRSAEFRPARPDELARVAREAAEAACKRHGAVIAVGGDGTINAVAQAAHDRGCVMGVVAQGTFNYFARSQGLSADAALAVRTLLRSPVEPVQVGLIGDHVFLVNASLGLYPELLQDREAYKARFGRSRFVAFGAALITLLRKHRQLRLHIELAHSQRDVRTPTLFVGNNRLQLEQVGLPEAPSLDEGCIAAVMLRPIGTLAMLGLLLRGAMGSLGEADSVESFKFHRMQVSPHRRWSRRTLKVAYDGEIGWMRLPLVFRVSPQPLHLLKPSALETPPT